MDFEIKHDLIEKRFYCQIEGQDCELDYDTVGTDILNFFHTYVPQEYRGQGVAESLLMEGAKYARQNGFRVDPSCSYAAVFFKRHKEFADLVKR